MLYEKLFKTIVFGIDIKLITTLILVGFIQIL